MGTTVTRVVATCIQSLENYLERSGVRLTRATLPQCIHGRLIRDRITLRTGLSPEQELVALVHELAHWLVHRNAQSGTDCTLFEYEAEAVERLVMERLGLTGTTHEHGPFGTGCPTDNLLSASVARVDLAAGKICDALGLRDPQPPSEAQTAIDVQTAAGEKIILEDEPHSMGNLFRLSETL